jgi:hypothetical protein
MQLVKPVERGGAQRVERDMDLIRELLLRIAANPDLNGTHLYAFSPADNFGDHSVEEINYHVDLLFEAGFIEGNPKSDVPMVSKLTWKGHEFVDNVRDSGVWSSVKERIKGLPSVGITVIGELALAEVKKRLHLG